MVEWSKLLPLTARCDSPLPEQGMRKCCQGPRLCSGFRLGTPVSSPLLTGLSLACLYLTGKVTIIEFPANDSNVLVDSQIFGLLTMATSVNVILRACSYFFWLASYFRYYCTKFNPYNCLNLIKLGKMLLKQTRTTLFSQVFLEVLLGYEDISISMKIFP